MDFVNNGQGWLYTVNAMNTQPEATWTLRESGVDVSAGGIWNGGRCENNQSQIVTENVVSDENQSEPKREKKRNRRRRRKSAAQKVEDIAYDSRSSISAETSNEDAVNANEPRESIPKRKRRRNRKRGQRKNRM